ncbi:type VII secretion protein EccB [Amycolatopsis sp. PS_44_ISF1]|uniref:type VII secretion protein EccB n=1 Tax=Amycolatopsis sp. PS_44_ISF1 TaxID=2974917 RepID=UPI0028DD7C48|nr:type VII secretion protein EccB [Amycolatopsis sp. PS_44_ISF1]MDT8914348.1 type VII secretion protein EccB [Amycolatopsis sp. PS_44_ISF1]
MWTQRDQIQAYQFLRRRLVSALVAADANHPTSPSRRLVLGTVLGLGVAVLVTAVFGVIGLLNPSGGKDWLAGGRVIVEDGTGARFVLGADGAVHPVLNYASARLLAGGNGDATVSVSSANLGTAPRGPQIGIPGAPDSLPAAAVLATTPWSSCSRTTQDAPASAEPLVAVLVGVPGNGVELPRDAGVIVRLPAGDRYLVTGGRRYKLSNEAAAALQFDSYPTIAVSSRWIDTVPAGRDLGAIPVPGAGEPGPRVGTAGTRVGEVLAVVDAMAAPGAANSYYLVLSGGLQPIGQTEASLLVTTSANEAAYDGRPAPVSVRAADVASVAKVAEPRTADPAAYPDRIPGKAPITGNSVTLCAQGGRIFVSADFPLPSGGRAITAAGRGDARVADQVFVPPSGGAVVTDAGSGTTYLVTDMGRKYPVASAPALASLGYGSVAGSPLPSGLLALVPTGPALDPAAAGQPVPSGGTG